VGGEISGSVPAGRRAGGCLGGGGGRWEEGATGISEPSPAPRRTRLLWISLGNCEQHSPNRGQQGVRYPLLIKCSKETWSMGCLEIQRGPTWEEFGLRWGSID